MSNDLTWNIHVDNIVSKAGKRLYMLYQLKRGGISQRELVQIYIAIIRPVLEYACPVWNTCLLLYLSEAIEMIQKRALRSIYPGMHYNDILMLLKLPRLKERRDGLCKTYFDRRAIVINYIICCPSGGSSHTLSEIKMHTLCHWKITHSMVFTPLYAKHILLVYIIWESYFIIIIVCIIICNNYNYLQYVWAF